MIPLEHVLWLAMLQVSLGLAGLLLRRSGPVVVLAGILMLNGVLLAVAGLAANREGAPLQAPGVVILAHMVLLVLSGAVVAYAFERFRRPLNVDEHDRMKH